MRLPPYTRVVCISTVRDWRVLAVVMSKTVTHILCVFLLALGTELDLAVDAAGDFIFILTNVAFAGPDADLFKLRCVDDVLVGRRITRTASKGGRAIHGFVD